MSSILAKFDLWSLMVLTAFIPYFAEIGKLEYVTLLFAGIAIMYSTCVVRET